LSELDANPCASAGALITTIIIQTDTYPNYIPRIPAEQEVLLKNISNQIVTTFTDILGQDIQ